MTTQQHDDLADTLIAISVISKRLAQKLKEEERHDQDKTAN